MKKNNSTIKWKDLKISPRLAFQLGSESMPSLYEAFVEYITNVDDSYERLAIEKKEKKWNGDCRIEYDLGGIKNNTTLVVKDRAEGMDFEKLEKNFWEYGEKQSGKANRGDAGRGAKDTANIGDMTVESIKDEKYSKIKIKSHPRKFGVLVKNDSAKKLHKNSIGTKRNGTKVTLEITPKKTGYHIKPKDLIEKLPKHYALQKILEHKNNTLNIKFESKDNPATLIYKPPEGKLVHEEKFYVNKVKKYFGEDALVTFKLYKSDIPLDTGHEDKRFRDWGILVMGKKAVHEKSLLSSELDAQPEGKKYFGVLQTNLFNCLSKEFEECRINGKSPPEHNPSPAIDLKRIDGVIYKHPTVMEILRIPREIIKKNILKDRANSEEKEIGNKETKKILDDIGKLCADLMEDLYEEENPEIDGIDIDANKWIIIPPKTKIFSDEKRYIYAYTKETSLKSGYQHAFIKTKDKENLIILENKASYKKSKRNKKLIYFRFQIQGGIPKDNIELQVYQTEKAICTSAAISVLPDKNREFKHDIEFEKEKYTVKQKKTRNIKIFAKVPEVISKDTEAKVFNSNQDNIKVIGKVIFEPFRKTNYAIGILKVSGEKISKLNEITVQLNENMISTYVDVLYKDEKDDEDKSQFQITIEKRDFGKTRYQWNIKNPNHLMIAGEHEQLKRYLGRKENNYPGQSTTTFKCLLAEVISESMVIKRMTLNSRYDPSTYEGILKSGTVEEIINNFTYRIEDEKSLFLKSIHEKCVKDGILSEEIKKFTKNL